MYVKKIKRKCSVRGCRNTSDVFVISRNRELGNSVAICRECLEEALAEIKDYVPPVPVTREEKPLFFHPEIEKPAGGANISDSNKNVNTETKPLKNEKGKTKRSVENHE